MSFDFTCERRGRAPVNDEELIDGDCDWPFCKCDHRAQLAIRILKDQGWLSPFELHDFFTCYLEDGHATLGEDRK